MHTGQLNSHSVITKYVSGKLILDPHSKKYVFPALNVSNHFQSMIDYDAHNITKIDYTIFFIQFFYTIIQSFFRLNDSTRIKYPS